MKKQEISGNLKARVEKIKKKLTPEQLEILKTKRLQGNFVPAKLIKLMQNLALLDEVGDVLRAKLISKRNRTMIYIVLSIMGGFGGGILLSEDLPQEALYIAVGAGVLTVFFIIRYIILGKKLKKEQEEDLDNGFRELILPLVAVFNEEIKAGTKLMIDVDSRDPLSEDFFVNKQAKRGNYGRDYYNYATKWLKGSLTFFDGSKFEFESEKSCQKIEITKRSSSGKIKHKSKFKLKEVTYLKIVFSKQQYRISDSALPNILRRTETESEIIVRGKFSRKSYQCDQIELDKFLNMIHTLYSTVKPIAS